MPNKLATSSRDFAIARIAARQHGVVTRAQLVAVGVLPSGISDRVSAGRLHRIHRGVYAVGHPRLSNEGMWMAAVLACGGDAVLSHRSAAALWRILPANGRPAAGTESSVAPVDVTVPGDGGRAQRTGLCLHRSPSLSPAECTIRAGVPVTTPGRTLEDLRRVLPGRTFASALREAEYLGLPVGDRLLTDHTRSELETRFLALLRRHRLPQPEVNVRVGTFVVDFLWRAEHLVVELDGWQAHGTRTAFEADRARDTQLRVAGFEVLRFTSRQATDQPKQVAKAVRSLLGR